MTTKEFKIEGMSCMHCVKAVDIELNKLPLNEKKVEIGSAKVSYDESKIQPAQIEEAIKEAGYKVVSVN